METLLQRVTGSRMMSMLDGFSGYNQVLVNKEYQHKKKLGHLGALTSF